MDNKESVFFQLIKKIEADVQAIVEKSTETPGDWCGTELPFGVETPEGERKNLNVIEVRVRSNDDGFAAELLVVKEEEGLILASSRRRWFEMTLLQAVVAIMQSYTSAYAHAKRTIEGLGGEPGED